MSASNTTLVRRARYGGRKGRSAAKRLKRRAAFMRYAPKLLANLFSPMLLRQWNRFAQRSLLGLPAPREKR